MSPVRVRCEVTDETWPHHGIARHYTLRRLPLRILADVARAIHPFALPRTVAVTGADLCAGHAKRLGVDERAAVL